MQASEFCYWLQGYIEIGHEQMHQTGLTHDQVEIIRRHLALVFVHDLDPAQVAEKLQEIHDGKPMQIGGVGPNGEVYRC